MSLPPPTPSTPGNPPPTVLVGDWGFTRTIRDWRHDEDLVVTGSVRLVAREAGVIDWHESGQLDRGGRLTPVWRDYVICRRAQGWMVTFADGRDFHPWAPEQEAVHPCGDDTYRGTYDLSLLPARWQARWRVTGPLKDYLMVTDLVALDGPVDLNDR